MSHSEIATLFKPAVSDSDSEAAFEPSDRVISSSRRKPKASASSRVLGQEIARGPATANSRTSVRATRNADTNADWNWAAFGTEVDDWKPSDIDWTIPSPAPAISKEASGVAQPPSSDLQHAPKSTQSNDSSAAPEPKDAVPSEGQQMPGHHCSGFPPCMRSFPRAADLAYHRHFHTGHFFGDQRSGRFPCHCGVRFENCTNLLRHEVGMHPGLAITADGIIERMCRDADSTIYDPPLPNFRSTIERLLADVLEQTADPATALWTIEAATPATINMKPSQAGKVELEIDLTVPEPAGNTEFERLCYICNRSVHIRRKKDWQKHVLEDLRPYQCVVESCPQSEETFPSAKELLKHHQVWHNHQMSNFPRCPFCEINLRPDLRIQIKHMARHMEEIAFAVVPRPNEDWDFYTSRGSSCREDLQPASMKPRRRKAMSRIPVPTKRRDQVPDPLE
jgi:hypothetical protein